LEHATHLEFLERDDISINRTFPDCGLGLNVVVVVSSCAGIDELPPLVRMVRLTVVIEKEGQVRTRQDDERPRTRTRRVRTRAVRAPPTDTRHCRGWHTACDETRARESQPKENYSSHTYIHTHTSTREETNMRQAQQKAEECQKRHASQCFCSWFSRFIFVNESQIKQCFKRSKSRIRRKATKRRDQEQ
jgi:hypothetical protein